MIKTFFQIGLFLSVSTLAVLATPQIPDTLIHEGKEYPIYNDVLQKYFEKYPDRNPKNEDYQCSAAWDGYHATFEIVAKKLYLKDLTDDPCGTGRSNPSILKKVVPGGDRLLIDFHTGVLLSMYGENNENAYTPQFLDAFSNYSLFEINAGNLEKVKHFNRRQYFDYRQRHFDAYKKTSKYAEELKKSLADGRTTTEAANSGIKFWIFWNAEKLLVD